MKTIEFNSDGKSTAFSPDEIPAEEFQKNEIFREILPLVFHKMKNKLTPVLGYAQILQSRSSDEFIIERLRKIEKNATELTDAFNILKDYFKAEPAPKQPGNINLILQAMGAHWQKVANSEQIRIVLDLDPKAPVLWLDTAQLKILLLNMVDNAAQALKIKETRDKEIRLATRMEDNALQLVIRDNGPGLSEEEIDEIWTPFYAKFPEHAGLGLVICEKVIANHAAVCLVSSSLGEFCQFEISFPLPEKPIKKKKKSAGKNPCSQV
ncbi:MAG: HAMP domain-containing histidine kinase [Chrysiogenales bacterium]|nr:MAG: HAMP domain-containing histidine kinase [Chrysiogenales bacterium]